MTTKKINRLKINGKLFSYRIRTRFPAKSKFSMLNLLRAIVSCGMNRLITAERLNFASTI